MGFILEEQNILKHKYLLNESEKCSGKFNLQEDILLEVHTLQDHWEQLRTLVKNEYKSFTNLVNKVQGIDTSDKVKEVLNVALPAITNAFVDYKKATDNKNISEIKKLLQAFSGKSIKVTGNNIKTADDILKLTEFYIVVFCSECLLRFKPDHLIQQLENAINAKDIDKIKYITERICNLLLKDVKFNDSNTDEPEDPEDEPEPEEEPEDDPEDPEDDPEIDNNDWIWNTIFKCVKQGKSFEFSDSDGIKYTVNGESDNNINGYTNVTNVQTAINNINSKEAFWKLFVEKFNKVDTNAAHYSRYNGAEPVEGLDTSNASVIWNGYDKGKAKLLELIDLVDRESSVFQSVYAANNPFLDYLWVILHKFKSNVDYRHFAMINNLVAKGLIEVNNGGINELIGAYDNSDVEAKVGYGYDNIIFCEDLFNQQLNNMERYVEIQHACIKAGMPLKDFLNNFYTDQEHRKLVSLDWLEKSVSASVNATKKILVDDKDFKKIIINLVKKYGKYAYDVAKHFAINRDPDNFYKLLTEFNNDELINKALQLPPLGTVSLENLYLTYIKPYNLSDEQFKSLLHALAIVGGFVKEEDKKDKSEKTQTTEEK